MRFVMALALLGAVGCTDKDGDKDGETGDTAEPVDGFVAVGSDLSGALLSIWGSSSTDVWTVGADADDGEGPLALHFDGSSWSRIDTGSDGDLWWVWGDGADTVVMVGDGGRVLTHAVGAGTTSVATVADTSLKLFGVWGTSADDLFVVGGDVNDLDGKIYHYDGTSWTESYVNEDRLVYKVWGDGQGAVYAVGTGGLGLSWDGEGWVDLPLPTSQDFFTVAGDGTQLYAVGGFGNGAVARLEGGAWVSESPPPQTLAPGFRGVSVGPDGTAMAVGEFGAIFLRGEEGWAAHPMPAPSQAGLHGAWIDPDGGQWAVGGDLTALTKGTLLYNGVLTVDGI